MEKEVHIRQREAVPATGSTLQLMPTGNLNSEVYEIDYFCLTGEVDESAKNWIRLYSSVMPEGHTGEERIIVEDGKIYIKVQGRRIKNYCSVKVVTNIFHPIRLLVFSDSYFLLLFYPSLVW